jgi:Recombination endonuclease VII
MLARQDGKCAICKCEFTHTPFVDHCHITGKVRRLLCRDCNTGLGRFKDDPHRLLAALQYLLEFLGDEAPFTVTVVPKSTPSSPHRSNAGAQRARDADA